MIKKWNQIKQKIKKLMKIPKLKSKIKKKKKKKLTKRIIFRKRNARESQVTRQY